MSLKERIYDMESARPVPPIESERSTPAAGTRLAVMSVPKAGALVGGVYRVLAPIGYGAMGTVLLAEDETLGRKVAIKFIRAGPLDSGFRERFTMEARAMARVSHPNVLQIHAFGDHEAAPYFVMEFVPGVTLEVWMETHQPLDVDRALQLMGRICAGVAAIHAAETVHRDIKPSNILVGADDHPWVADLGLATFARLVRGANHQVVGTPAYMAPEVAFPIESDMGFSERADVYSLACIAYEMVTGSAPFDAEGNTAMMLQHAVEPVKPPSSVRPGLPVALDEALLHGLEKNPLERTPSVTAFGAALEAARAGIRKPARILVIDDNDDFRESLAAGLAGAFPGAEIECVRDGREALEAFDRKRPSLIILDLDLPDLHGMQLTREIRKRDPGAAIPIIVVTGSGGPKEWALLSAMGVDRLLVKPVSLDDVIALVHRLMTERSKSSLPPRMNCETLTD
jgi:serine/threonine-protein kinase